MKPVCIEVVTNLFTSLGHCRHCDLLLQESGLSPAVRGEDSNAYPPLFHEEWKKLREILRELRHLYRHRIVIRLVDADSPLGLYKALRHRFRRHPTSSWIRRMSIRAGISRKSRICWMRA